MFITHNQVRMHDTDMAGILYFPRQFRFAHDALEDLFSEANLSFHQIFHKENFVFVIVHAEADYLATLRVGDKLEVHVTIERIGTSSFTVVYRFYLESSQKLVGTAKTVHVTLENSSRIKIPIPETLKVILMKHLEKNGQ